MMDKDCIFNQLNALGTEDLEQALRENVFTCRYFCSVLARDEIALHQCSGNYPRIHIINTDPVKRQGQHWLAFIRDSPRDISIYDSYGLHPALYSRSLFKDLKCFSKFGTMYINPFHYQSAHSIVCGHYGLFFSLLHLKKKKRIALQIPFLTPNKFFYRNDRLVFNYVHLKYPTLSHLCIHKTQSCISYAFKRK